MTLDARGYVFGVAQPCEEDLIGNTQVLMVK
jgi:hypothetical protein